MEEVRMNFDKNFIDRKQKEIKEEVKKRALYNSDYSGLSPKEYKKVIEDRASEIFNDFINIQKKARTFLEGYGVKTYSNIDYSSLLSGEEIDTELKLIKQLKNRKEVSNKFKNLDSEKSEKLKDFLSIDDDIDMDVEIRRSEQRLKSNDSYLSVEKKIVSDEQNQLMSLKDISRNKKQALNTIAGENVNEDDLAKAKETLEKIKENFDYSKGSQIRKENNKEYFRKTNKHSMDEVSSKKFGKMGKIGAYAAAGTLLLGGLTLALSDSRGQQTNGQLYGQQPLY